MASQRTDAAVTFLKKQCKAEGKSYYEATQTLEHQGFSQSEIEQASYQFPYSDIAQPNEAPIQSTAQSQSGDEEIAEAELAEAKQQVVHDTWYQYIPLIGVAYRLKWFGDYAKYESLKTGYRKSTVLVLWAAVMFVAMIAAFMAPEWASKINFLNNTAGLYISHYLSVIIAVVLLALLFRKKKRQQ